VRLYCLMSAAHQFGRASPRARFFIGRKRRGHISRDPHFCGRWETRAFGIFGLKADCNGPWINLSNSGTSVNLRDRGAAWRKAGWQNFDPNAAPYTVEQIRRERELYRSSGGTR
jgi:hypothetical protein